VKILSGREEIIPDVLSKDGQTPFSRDAGGGQHRVVGLQITAGGGQPRYTRQSWPNTALMDHREGHGGAANLPYSGVVR